MSKKFKASQNKAKSKPQNKQPDKQYNPDIPDDLQNLNKKSQSENLPELRANKIIEIVVTKPSKTADVYKVASIDLLNLLTGKAPLLEINCRNTPGIRFITLRKAK